MDEPYRTVADRGQADFEVKGSEFIGHVAPADSVAAAEAFITEVGEAYADATHNVPAYRVPAEGGGEGTMLREWSSDDGEPTGSAGKPALNVLVQRDLRNVVAVVTRYYGGVNLGVGGLARAYARGVSDAVDAAGVVEEHPHERLTITVDYDDSGTVRSILESEGVEFDAAYEARVQFDVRVPVADADMLRDRLRSATGGRVELS
ncbi:MAG: YigZ family protein [Haloplanus sp.]